MPLQKGNPNVATAGETETRDRGDRKGMIGRALLPFILVSMVLNLWACGLHPKASHGPSGANGTKASEIGPYYYYAQSRLMGRQGKVSRAAELLRDAAARDPESTLLKRELAQLYLQLNDPHLALSIAENLTKGDAEDVASLVMLGGIHSALDHQAEAIQAYERALALDPDSESVYLLLGLEHIRNKDLGRARDTYERLIERDPTSFRGHFHLGSVFVALKSYDAAEAAFLKCLELRPDYEETLFELINIYEATGRDEKVVDTYEKVLESNPDSIKAAVGLGHFYLKMGLSEEAKDRFEELKLRSRSNPLVVKQIALIYLDQKKYGEAADILQALLGDDPDQPELHYFLGMALRGLEKSDEAISAYEKVPEASSYYSSAVIHLSFLYQEKEEGERAVQLMQRALEKEPDEPDLYLFLGALYEDMEAFDQAIHTLKKGLDLEPNNARLHFGLGVVYDKAGDKELCIEEMSTVIEIDPTHAEALNYLGYTYAEQGTNLDEAEDLIKKALEHKPNDGYITDSLGWVYFQKGRYKEAIEFLEQAAVLVPDDPTILEHLGDAYVKAKDPDNGLLFYKKALEQKEKDNDDDTSSLRKKIESFEKPLGRDG